MAGSSTTTNQYFDNRHYLCGFSRHSDFIAKEAQLPEHHGYAFNELDLGRREPVIGEEKLFVAVCRGGREPVTEAECAWSRYITRIKCPKRFHTLSGGEPQAEGAGDYTDFDD